MRTVTFALFAMIMVAVLVLPAAAQSVVPASASRTAPAAHVLIISSGDLLEIGVFDVPDLTGKLRVNENGDIMLPLAGALRVSGMTAEQAAEAIEARLRSAEIVTEPHVSVFVSEYATQGVTIVGEVRTPGIYPLLGSHGLVDLLSAAGGVSASAGRIVSVTHKVDPEHPEILRLDNQPGKMVANVDIQPGDTIMVPKAGVAYIVGDVNHAGGFLIDVNDRLTVLQVIALAGGAGKTASMNKTRLIRKTPTGREEIVVPLKSILNGKEKDIALEDGDILFVPSSKGKIFAYRGTDVAIGLTTGLAIAGKF